MKKWARFALRIALRTFAFLVPILLVILVSLVGYLAFLGVFRPVDFSPLNDEREVSIIYDASGARISEGCDQFCREVIPREMMGRFPEFAVAADDRGFHDRKLLPIDLLGIFRAATENTFSGEAVQGASTLEQQLARTLLTPDERRREREEMSAKAKWIRKFREIRVAFALKKRFSKDEILDLYLNNIYCGENRSGIQACSQWYFRKNPSELTLGEAAMVIATWRSPRSSPFFSVERAHRARERVLGQLLKNGKINKGEADAAFKEQLGTSRPGLEVYAKNFAEYVRKSIVGKQRFVDQGLRVHTTLDPKIQLSTISALRESLDAMKARNSEISSDLCGAALVIDAKTGAVKAWAQISPFLNSEFDLISQAKRHPGSAFKAFLYAFMVGKRGWRASVIDEGFGPYQVDDGSSIVVPMGGGGLHAIENFPYRSMPRFLGRVDLLTALAHSRNAAAMSVVSGVRGSTVPIELRISKEELLRFTADLGIMSAEEGLKAILWGNAAAKERWDPGLTLPLGSIDVSVYEMVRAWTALRGGWLIEPHVIESIETKSGSYHHEFSRGQNVFDEKTAFSIVRLLRAPVELPGGTARGLRDEKRFGFRGDAIGKTGTSSNNDRDATDNWFVGCTPNYCMGVWIGRNTRLPLARTTDPVTGEDIYETGGRNALPVFAKVMKMISVYDGEYAYFPEKTDPRKLLPKK